MYRSLRSRVHEHGVRISSREEDEEGRQEVTGSISTLATTG